MDYSPSAVGRGKGPPVMRQEDRIIQRQISLRGHGQGGTLRGCNDHQRHRTQGPLRTVSARSAHHDQVWHPSHESKNLDTRVAIAFGRSDAIVARRSLRQPLAQLRQDVLTISELKLTPTPCFPTVLRGAPLVLRCTRGRCRPPMIAKPLPTGEVDSQEYTEH